MTDEEQTIEEPEPPQVGLMDEVENLAGTLMKIAKKTKMSENGILNVFSFIWQQNEQAKQQAMAQPSGQDLVDQIAQEQADKEEMQTREADEDI